MELWGHRVEETLHTIAYDGEAPLATVLTSWSGLWLEVPGWVCASTFVGCSMSYNSDQLHAAHVATGLSWCHNPPSGGRIFATSRAGRASPARSFGRICRLHSLSSHVCGRVAGTCGPLSLGPSQSALKDVNTASEGRWRASVATCGVVLHMEPPMLPSLSVCRAVSLVRRGTACG